MKEAKLTVLQRIGLACLWHGARLFALLPYWFKYYAVENLLYFLLFRCIRYRRRVVTTNLRNSFPEKSEAELRTIRRRFYRTLAEMIVDTIDLARIDERKVRRLLEIDDYEGHARATQGRDWIAMMAHFGCWEYCSYWGFYDPSHKVVAVYHPLRPDSRWFRFLNQDTIFFDGGEKLALRCGLPVYFVRMERLRRGRYRMSFELIYDGEEQVAPYEITERYVRRLESMIRERPELWIWSHRRWKRKRPHAAR